MNKNTGTEKILQLQTEGQWKLFNHWDRKKIRSLTGKGARHFFVYRRLHSIIQDASCR